MKQYADHLPIFEFSEDEKHDILACLHDAKVGRGGQLLAYMTDSDVIESLTIRARETLFLPSLSDGAAGRRQAAADRISKLADEILSLNKVHGLIEEYELVGQESYIPMLQQLSGLGNDFEFVAEYSKLAAGSAVGMKHAKQAFFVREVSFWEGYTGRKASGREVDNEATPFLRALIDSINRQLSNQNREKFITSLEDQSIGKQISRALKARENSQY